MRYVPDEKASYSVDPVGEKGSDSKQYTYAGSSPVNGSLFDSISFRVIPTYLGRSPKPVCI